MEIRQFREDGFSSHASRLPDDEYGRALDNIVVCCVDCVVTCGSSILLGFRRQEPHPGWWVMGGRMNPGERFEETAQRVMGREVGLTNILPNRFRYISTNSYVWRQRAQSPADHGCHMLGVNLALKISVLESTQIVRAKDYETLEWFQLRGVFQNDAYHPAIRGFAESLPHA